MNPIEKLGVLANDNIRLINMTSKGLLSKGWFNINGKICLVKGNLDWHEPYSEVLASNLAEVLGLHHIIYWLEPASIFSSIKTYYNCEHVSVCEKYALDGEYYLKTFHSFMHDYYENVKMFLERGTQHMTKGKFIGWLEESRCIDRHRVDVEDVLKYYGVSHYDPLLIVQKTKGSMYPLDDVTIEITDLVYSEDW